MALQSLKNTRRLSLLIAITYLEIEAKIRLVINFGTYIFPGRILGELSSCSQG